MKHTQGIWEVDYTDGFCTGVKVALKRGYGYEFAEMIVNTILPDTDEKYEMEKETIEANAKLIAAAPDMLKALTELMNVYETKGHLLSFNLDMARKAIRKATNTSDRKIRKIK